MKLTALGRFFLFVVGLALAATAFYRFAPAELRTRWLGKVGLGDAQAASANEPSRTATMPAVPATTAAVALAPAARGRAAWRTFIASGAGRGRCNTPAGV